MDLTSTGNTLVQNHLKEIEGGTVCKTQACLVASTRTSLWNAESLGVLEELTQHMEARLRARAGAEIRFSLPRQEYLKARAMLSREYNCSFSLPLGGVDDDGSDGIGAWVEGGAFCEKKYIYGVVSRLRSLGCNQVAVQRREFAFEGSARSVDRLRSFLKHRDVSKKKSSAKTEVDVDDQVLG